MIVHQSPAVTVRRSEKGKAPMRRGIMIVLCIAVTSIAGGTLLIASAGGAPEAHESTKDRPTAAQEADAAIAQGRDGVLRALRSGDQAVANELLKRATTSDTGGTIPPSDEP